MTYSVMVFSYGVAYSRDFCHGISLFANRTEHAGGVS
ncbi:hypothetical protein BTHE_1866 [Bifidobacterium thermophilum]|nr:hypothetical protein BTHE_1866 [Bifidobacterium thermophilum]